MWCSGLLITLVALDLESSFGSTGAEPSGGGRNRHPSNNGLPFGVFSQQAAEAGRVVREEIQQRLEPFER